MLTKIKGLRDGCQEVEAAVLIEGSVLLVSLFTTKCTHKFNRQNMYSNYITHFQNIYVVIFVLYKYYRYSTFL